MNKEFIEKAKKLESVDEIKELAQRENIELSEEELSKIAGGLNVIMGPREQAQKL